jgi:hypothetical protein
MELNILKPRLSLNKAFLKVKPNRPDIEVFKKNLISLIATIDEFESEEFYKNEVSAFLQNTYYSGSHYIISNLSQPPITSADKDINESIVNLAEQILSSKRQNQDTTALEFVIDQLIYQMYGLTDEEIKIVEGKA